MNKAFLSKEQVQQLNEKHGWFEFRDAQSDVSNAFANEAIERYERIRSAAPELLEALQALENYVCNNITNDYPTGIDIDSPAFRKASAAIAKATGEQA